MTASRNLLFLLLVTALVLSVVIGTFEAGKEIGSAFLSK